MLGLTSTYHGRIGLAVAPLHVGDDAHERLLNVKLAVRGQALLQLVNVAALGLWIGWRMTHFDAVN